MKKKYLIIAISIIILVAIIYGIYIVLTSYLFNEDWTIPNGHDALIETIKNTSDTERRKKSIDDALSFNLITPEEANELY